MNILLTGGSGLIGTTFAAERMRDGATVAPIVRDRASPPDRPRWHVPDTRADAVVHLAGASIDCRWTPEAKRVIRDSRVRGTTELVRALAERSPRPSVLVSASAVGWYGDRGDEPLDEASSPGHGFLPSLCADWEAAAQTAGELGMRVVCLRLGVVLDPKRGALARMLPIYRLGLGGRLGGGRQWVSWISAHDAARAIAFVLSNETSGPVNVAAPEPVRQADLARALGRVVRRPTPWRIPAWAVGLLFGEMGRTLLLQGQRVSPGALSRAGFAWRHTRLTETLDALLRP